MSNDAIETEVVEGFTIEVFQDEYPESPREWDNLGTMYCLHKRYNLGDKHNLSMDHINALAARVDAIALPLYLLDHSGITMRCRPFGGVIGMWDSGQVGWIIVTKEKVRKEYSVKSVGKAMTKRVIKYLMNEVETYDQYLTGQVYQVRMTSKDGEEVDEVGGLFGMDYVKEVMGNYREEAKRLVKVREYKQVNIDPILT